MNFGRLNSFLNWSIRVGHLFGVPINLHISLLFFLYPVLAGRGLGFWYSLEYAAAVILSILLHELGHALTAKRYRLSGLSIMLHGFGGFAVSSGYRTPAQAMAITLAGPAVTFALGFICLGLGTIGLNMTSFGTGAYMQFHLLHYLGTLNLLLGVLNMLPTLPLDGGHAVQALLSRRMSDFKALRGAAHIGLVVAPLVLLYGLATKNDFVGFFGLLGTITCVGTLLQTGGIRFGELLADWRTRQEMEEVKRREEARTAAYIDEVWEREKARDERERLRKLFEKSGMDT